MGCHSTLPQRNGCSHLNNIPLTKLANHSFCFIFKTVFAANSPFETCPIRDRFLFLYGMVEKGKIAMLEEAVWSKHSWSLGILRLKEPRIMWKISISTFADNFLPIQRLRIALLSVTKTNIYDKTNITFSSTTYENMK